MHTQCLYSLECTGIVCTATLRYLLSRTTSIFHAHHINWTEEETCDSSFVIKEGVFRERKEQSDLVISVKCQKLRTHRQKSESLPFSLSAFPITMTCKAAKLAPKQALIKGGWGVGGVEEGSTIERAKSMLLLYVDLVIFVDTFSL